MVPSCFVIAVVLVSFIHADEMDWTSLKHHPSWRILDDQFCGETSADRIIGGTNAAIGQFPWLVRLGYIVEGDDEMGWLCGGSLITNRHVLTAAHCASGDNMAEYKLHIARLGEYNIETDPDCQHGICAPPVQDIIIRQILVHEYFNNPRFHNDIALLNLEKAAEISPFVVPLCIPREEQPQLVVGEQCIVAGWGKMNVTTDERASILQFVQLPILENEVCNQLNTKLFKITENEICAGAQFNKDACGGDSGGPLMKVYDTEEGPKSFVVGVVSFGPTQCGIRKPGVYTAVHRYLHWILDHLK